MQHQALVGIALDRELEGVFGPHDVVLLRRSRHGPEGQQQKGE
jgi:hypothetical protein